MKYYLTITFFKIEKIWIYMSNTKCGKVIYLALHSRRQLRYKYFKMFIFLPKCLVFQTEIRQSRKLWSEGLKCWIFRLKLTFFEPKLNPEARVLIEANRQWTSCWDGQVDSKTSLNTNAGICHILGENKTETADTSL